ncbi:MAG: hypothetical protein JO287_14565 [Pseudonocardiales bacterium]|nr:hypothetical protein [Pseudonocardiales bacterium]
MHYPGAVIDPNTGGLISGGQVAETTYTAFTSTKNPVTARLIVRRVRDPTTKTPCSQTGLSPVVHR